MAYVANRKNRTQSVSCHEVTSIEGTHNLDDENLRTWRFVAYTCFIAENRPTKLSERPTILYFKDRERDKLRTVRIVVGLITGLIVSSQSMYGYWLLPLATNEDLYQSREPLARNLRLYNHIERTKLTPCGRETSTQVPLLIRALYLEVC